MTVKLAVTEFFVEPLVPVIVRVEVPVGVDLAVTTVKVDDAVLFALLSVTAVGANEAVVPVGNPVTLNATEPANPLAPIAVTV